MARRTVGTNLGVFPRPSFDQHLRLPKSIENLWIQKLVSPFAIERFNVSVFPGTSRLNEERFHFDLPEPLPNSVSSEFRAIT